LQRFTLDPVVIHAARLPANIWRTLIMTTEHIRELVPAAQRMFVLLEIDQLIGNDLVALGELQELVA
jgi:hypothetical protein